MLSRERVVGAVSSGALTVVNSLTHAIAVFTLVLFFTILMLAEVPVWARKAASATDGEGHRTWYQATGGRFAAGPVVSGDAGACSGRGDRACFMSVGCGCSTSIC